jgi:phosphohistidine swiveling domain-containing protein
MKRFNSIKWKKYAYDFTSPLIHPASYLNVGASKKLEKILGIKAMPVCYELRNKGLKWCYVEDNFLDHSKKVLEIFQDKKSFEYICKKSIKTIQISKKEADNIFKKNLQKVSNKELFEMLDDIYKKLTEMNLWGHLVNLTDFDHNMLSNKINSLLKNKVKDLKPSEAFVILTTPLKINLLKQQEIDFFKLLDFVQKVKNPKIIDKAIEDHKKKYDWISFKYDGPTIHDKNYFKQLIDSEIKQEIKGYEQLEKIRQKRKKLMKEQKELIRKLDLTNKEIHLIDVAKECMYIKAQRKDIVFYVSRKTDPLIKEIGKRINLSKSQVRSIILPEIKKALLENKDFSNQANDRIKHSIIVYDNEETFVYSGKEAKEMAKKIYEDEAEDNITELKGSPACTGEAKGRVKIIQVIEDMKKMNQGDILVSTATQPDLMPAIKKSSAIITDEGGITCHAAIVSRELNIPCIIGTKIATKVLEDNDFVEVDAKKGIIKIIK